MLWTWLAQPSREGPVIERFIQRDFKTLQCISGTEKCRLEEGVPAMSVISNVASPIELACNGPAIQESLNEAGHGPSNLFQCLRTKLL
jgi:hypothetical protein